MFEKYGITQAQADKFATQGKDMFLITYNKVFQFVWRAAQGLYEQIAKAGKTDIINIVCKYVKYGYEATAKG